ncbi:MAG TPA: hypothetical protein VII55_02105 [Candidatus Saccharimonadales bacterium]
MKLGQPQTDIEAPIGVPVIGAEQPQSLMGSIRDFLGSPLGKVTGLAVESASVLYMAAEPALAGDTRPQGATTPLAAEAKQAASSVRELNVQAHAKAVSLTRQMIALGLSQPQTYSLQGASTPGIDQISIIVKDTQSGPDFHSSGYALFAKLPAPAGSTQGLTKQQQLARFNPNSVLSVLVNDGDTSHLILQKNTPHPGSWTAWAGFITDSQNHTAIVEASTTPLRGEQLLTRGRLGKFFNQARQIIGDATTNLPSTYLKPPFPRVHGQKIYTIPSL